MMYVQTKPDLKLEALSVAVEKAKESGISEASVVETKLTEMRQLQKRQELACNAMVQAKAFCDLEEALDAGVAAMLTRPRLAWATWKACKLLAEQIECALDAAMLQAALTAADRISARPRIAKCLESSAGVTQLRHARSKAASRLHEFEQ